MTIEERRFNLYTAFRRSVARAVEESSDYRDLRRAIETAQQELMDGLGTVAGVQV